MWGFTGGSGLPNNGSFDFLSRTRTPFDFGAKGDGAADDTAAVQSAINAAFSANGNGFVYIPRGMFKITSTLTYSITSHRFRNFGIISHGGVLKSALNSSTANVLEILVGTAANAQVRHLTIDGLGIEGQGAGSALEQDGLYIACVNGGDGAILCARLINVTIESCGRHGLHGQGDFFESKIAFSHFRGNGGRGTWLENGAGTGSPVVSSLHIIGCNFSENVAHGLRIETPVNDAYVGFSDFISNGDAGIASVNGGQFMFNHMENNHTAKGSAAAGQGGIHCNNFATLVGNVFKSSGASCKQTAGLVTTNVNNQSIIGGEIEASGGAPAPALVTLSSGGTAGRSMFIQGVTLAGGATFCNDTPVSNLVIDGYARPINFTAGRTLTQQESGGFFTNSGASGSVTMTLPASPLIGTEYTFAVLAAQNFVVDANTGQTIRIAGSTSTSGGTATNATIGGILKIKAVSTTLWLAEYSTGTWTLA